MSDDGDEDEARLRKEALAAQGEYYRLKADELKSERARTKARERQVAFAQDAAGDAVIKASEGLRKTASRLRWIVLVVLVVGVLAFLASANR